MGYYVRAFCTSADVPPLAVLVAWAAQRGITLRVAEPEGGGAPIDLTSPDWRDAEFLYAEGRQPIPTEVERDDGAPGSLLKEEVAQFLELLQDAEDTPER